MRPALMAFAVCVCSAAAACTGAGGQRPSTASQLVEAPDDVPPRLLIADDRIVAAAVPVGPGALPAAVRTTFDAIAPGGRTTFVGREWGERGDGFRLEKTYQDGAQVSTRSVLAGRDGAVLERSHSVPLRNAPQHVLATALRTGPVVEEVRIVSGPEREEFWSLLVRDRIGRLYVVRVGLDGAPLARLRRFTAQLDSGLPP